MIKKHQVDSLSVHLFNHPRVSFAVLLLIEQKGPLPFVGGFLLLFFLAMDFREIDQLREGFLLSDEVHVMFAVSHHKLHQRY